MKTWKVKVSYASRELKHHAKKFNCLQCKRDHEVQLFCSQIKNLDFVKVKLKWNRHELDNKIGIQKYTKDDTILIGMW